MNSAWIFVAALALYFVFRMKNRTRSKTASTDQVRSGTSLKLAMKLPKERQAEFLLCTFSLLGKVATADGELEPVETQRVEQYIQDRLQLTPKYRSVAQSVFSDACKSEVSYREYVEKFRKSFPERDQLSSALIDVLLEVSTADGELSSGEDEMLRSISLLLDFSEEHYELKKGRYLGYH